MNNMHYKTPVFDAYMATLLFLCPITSILLIPSIQGTTPATLLIALSPALLILRGREFSSFLLTIIIFIGGLTALVCGAFIANMLSEPQLGRAVIVRDSYIGMGLRLSHVTQSIYLLISVVFFAILHATFKEKYIKYIFNGIVFLALFGYYNYIYFFLFKYSGDFLSNRIFDNGMNGAAGAMGPDAFGALSGSLIQSSGLLGPAFMRLNSLTGEPSMYALTVVPFCLYAYQTRRFFVFSFLLISLIMSESTTAIVGMFTGFLYLNSKNTSAIFLLLIAVVAPMIISYFAIDSFRNFIDLTIFNKFGSLSGTERTQFFLDNIQTIFDGNIFRFMFGLGFGTVRSPDMTATLVANVGVLGYTLYIAIFLIPCFRMPECRDKRGVIAALLSILVMEITSVSEFAYLPPWFILALAYQRAFSQSRKNDAKYNAMTNKRHYPYYTPKMILSGFRTN